MSANTRKSGSDLFCELLGIIWQPAVEAHRFLASLEVHSLAETCDALRQAGFEVAYVDFPDKVSGLATVIACEPHILVNRAKPRAHQQYTVSHELGHHVLHVSPPTDSVVSAVPIEGLEEFQANMFASAWVMFLAKDKEREELLRHNPELGFVVLLSVLMTAAILVAGLIAYLWERHHARLAEAARQ